MADRFIKPLQEIGYNHNTEHQSTERHFFRKGNPTTYHLSIAYKDQGGFWKRQILFRDYLRNHPALRDEYAGLKKKLLEKYPDGKDTYIEGKTEFVEKVLERARKEQS